jgi:hypothetical protein
VVAVADAGLVGCERTESDTTVIVDAIPADGDADAANLPCGFPRILYRGLSAVSRSLFSFYLFRAVKRLIPRPGNPTVLNRDFQLRKDSNAPRTEEAGIPF